MSSLGRPRLALLGAAVTLALLGQGVAGQPGPKPPEGFEALFNGRDLNGWEGSTKDWKVEDGCLTGTADGKLKHNRFLVWGGGTPRVVTAGSSSAWSPYWSKDGRSLYFLSDRAAGSQLWKLPLDTFGEAQQVTSLKQGVDAIQFSPDESRLLLSFTDTAIAEPVEAPKKK